MKFAPILFQVMTTLSDITSSEVDEMIWNIENKEHQEQNINFSMKKPLDYAPEGLRFQKLPFFSWTNLWSEKNWNYT